MEPSRSRLSSECREGDSPLTSGAAGQSSRVKSSKNKDDGRLAVCDSCGFEGKDLTKCSLCNHVFGPNVKIIQNSFVIKPRIKHDSGSSSVKTEVLEHMKCDPQSSPPGSFFPPEASSDRVDSHQLNKRDSTDVGRPSTSGTLQHYEKRLRVIHSSQSSRSMVFHVKHNTKEKKTVFHGQTNIEDTIIEEIRMSDAPHIIRIVQITPVGAEQILKEETYKSDVRKIIFGCPSTLDFVHDMLSNTSRLKGLRFGVHAFNLTDGETESSSNFIENVEFKELKSLEMAFDRSRYEDYDAESKEIMRSKISAILKIASTAFPNLVDCDITVPVDIESYLDSFLRHKPDIKARGCKKYNYKENTIRFYVEGNSNNQKEIEKEEIPNIERQSVIKVSVAKTNDIEVIELSDDEELTTISSSEISSTSKRSTNQSTLEKLESSTPSLNRRDSGAGTSSPPLDWDDEQQYYITGHVAFCRCGTKSVNLMCCDGCNRRFPPKTVFVNIDNAPRSETKEKSKEESKISNNVPHPDVVSGSSSVNQGSKRKISEMRETLDFDSTSREARVPEVSKKKKEPRKDSRYKQ